jgi:hypothetical protein
MEESTRGRFRAWTFVDEAAVVEEVYNHERLRHVKYFILSITFSYFPLPLEYLP